MPETADSLWDSENWSAFVLLWLRRVPVGDCFCLAERDTLGIEYLNLKKQQHLLVAGSLCFWSPAVVWSHQPPAEWDYAQQLGAQSITPGWPRTSLCPGGLSPGQPDGKNALGPPDGSRWALE